MWTEAGRLAKDRLRSRKEGKGDDDDAAAEGATVEEPSSSSRKRRKLASAADAIEIDGMLAEWDLFAADVSDFDIRHVRAGGRFVFSFVEGPLVKALRRGDW
jgi:midasin